jgi:hypothetical protein
MGEERAMAEMSKRERVLRTTNLQETDRVPVYDILENDAAIEHYAQMPLTVENGDRVKGRAIGRCLDATRMVRGPQPLRTWTDERGFRYEGERWTMWITQRPWEDQAGMIEWIKGEIQRTNEQVFDEAYRDAFYATMDRFQGYFGDDTVQIVESGVGLTEMYWWLDWEAFSYLMADDPDLVEEWLEARTRAEIRRAHCIGDPSQIPIALTYDDIAYKNTTLLSPRWLRRYWVPRLERLVAAWHEQGCKCLFHSDGNLYPVLDDLVSVGIDGLNPIEVAAGMTVREVRRRHPHLFLTGGVDVSELLARGTPEQVYAAAKENIEATGGVGYLMGSSTELDWEIPAENVIAMIDAAWDTAR